MAKYRKKPVVIEAEQFHYRNKPWPDGVVLRKGISMGFMNEDEMPCIDTLEGNLLVSEGDWIITGVKGEKYPRKSDIFEATYEPV